MNSKYHFSFILILFPFILHAQTDGLGSWNIFHAKYNFNKKWSIFTEAQLRSLGFYNKFHYHEFKGGFSYKAHKNLAISAGIGNFQTYKEGGNFVLPKNNNELRIWPQLTLYHYFPRVVVEHRYRLESRFTSNGYRNRYRYRLLVSYDFGKEKNGFKPFQLSAGTEIFFTDREPFFERNRINVNFNYKVSKMLSLHVGYLNQIDFRINDEIGRDFLQIGIYLDFSPNKTEKSQLSTDHNEN
jgi:hypothetical protein